MTETVVDPVEAVKQVVLTKLGHPKNVFKVDVKPISEHSYRVNVWTKDGEGLVCCGKITHSEVVRYETLA